MTYKHLTFAQRCKIAAYWKVGNLQNEIAKELGVSESTISRELKRNIRWNGVYSPEQAQSNYNGRRKHSRKEKKLTDELKAIIREKIELEWSPEQISGYGKRHRLFKISHECVYQFVLKDKKAGGQLYLHLRRGKKKYKKRYGSAKRIGAIKNRVFIDDRPKIVDEKIRVGDWEIDTIVGKQHQRAIVTLVGRITKKTLISQVIPKRADSVTNQTMTLLEPFKDYVFTITADNGCEFAQHERIAGTLEAKIFFAHPYHSWECGLNENTNGLIRQYIPKGSDLNDVDEENISHIMDRLNNRPRKALGYATPNERFQEHSKMLHCEKVS